MQERVLGQWAAAFLAAEKPRHRIVEDLEDLGSPPAAGGIELILPEHGLTIFPEEPFIGLPRPPGHRSSIDGQPSFFRY